MTVLKGPEPVAEILRSMAGDPQVCGELVRAARTRSPELSRITEPETFSHVLAMVTAAAPWFAALDRAEAIDEQDFGAALLLGADRAVQGVPMTAVLRGVQAATTRAAEIVVDRCRSAGVSDRLLLSLMLRLKEYGDALERQVVNGYRAAEQQAPRQLGELRAELIRRLFLDGDAPSDRELARAGIRPNDDGLLHCFAASPAHPGTAFTPRPFTTVLAGHLAGVCARPPEPVGLDADVLVVVSPAVPLGELRALYRLCAHTVDLGRGRGLRGRYELTDSAAELALAHQPLLGAQLSRRLLGPLDQGDAFHRQLALTALTFLDQGRRLDRTASALFTHPHTVRYRLGRLQDITGGSLTDLPCDGRSRLLSTLQWWWALTDWLRPPGTARVRSCGR
ncbi:helix-turn-helix domain-containing protein [Streptomyces sp. NPDC091279]|uniref:helix-turn-helix domain-containing protein n=1 Tax=Streptomyces sp. NPDC091279 TaxID=3365983 RepID=UPI00382104C8